MVRPPAPAIRPRSRERQRVVRPPATFILLGAKGPNAGRTIPCIYQLAGNRLRVCYGLDGTTPTAFATTAGSPHYLATYRRKTLS